MSAAAEAAVTALVPSPAPATGRALVLSEALEQDTKQRALLREYIDHHMVKDVDYGVIPGTKKPTLLKPGAEKLTDLFRCRAKFTLQKCVEDWDKPLFYYQYRCQLVSRDTGEIMAEGFGSANSREARYRWRDAQRKCPLCGQAAIIKGKDEYGGGWVCFKKKGGCNAKWVDGAREIEGQELGRVENDDIFTLVNTILKMATKRTQVAAAIALARCSDVFTQDVEDLNIGGGGGGHGYDNEPPPREEPPPRDERPPQQPTQPPQQRAPQSAPARSGPPVRATDEEIEQLVAEINLSKTRADLQEKCLADVRRIAGSQHDHKVRVAFNDRWKQLPGDQKGAA